MRVRARRFLPLAAASAAVLFAGCATPSRIAYQPEALHEELARRLGPEQAAAFAVPFEVGPEMRRLAEDATRGVVGHPAKLAALAAALSHPSEMRLRYDVEITASAEETLRRGGGDCLSLTGLFVGMARSIGLQVVFVDARGVQQLEIEGNLVLDRRHMVAGFGPSPGFTIVDFDRVSAGPAQYRILSDIQALARFANNAGFAALRERRDEDALAAFETALALDPAYAPAHNNAAIALLRLGRTPKAEEHLLLALRDDPNYAAAMVNLAGVLERDGRHGLADGLRREASAVRSRDPLWRLRLGQEALARGDHGAAVEEFRASVKLDAKLTAGWKGLADAYAALGDRERALAAAKRAERLAPPPGAPAHAAGLDKL